MPRLHCHTTITRLGWRSHHDEEMKVPLFLSHLVVALFLTSSCLHAADWVWIEGEDATQTNIGKHPWYSNTIKKDELSGNDFLAHFSDAGPGVATYEFQAPSDGDYELWVRANPVQTKMSYQLNAAEFAPIDLTREQAGNINLAPDNAPDLRFIAWVKVGTVPLKAGANKITFTFEGKVDQNFHGSLDCFIFSRAPFTPMGTAQPDQIAGRIAAIAEENKGWSVWNPALDPFQESPIDLRRLNEKIAGENGFVTAKDGRFFLGNGQPVRFWAVNGPPSTARGDELKRHARDLAKKGVNLVRIHGSVFDRATGELKPDSIAHFHEVIDSMKAEGIYVHLSIYFPLWMTPRPGLPFLEGYDGQKHPFAALYFNADFQKVYRDWWTSILTARGPGGKTILEEPAVMGVEIINEDSYFFWTFNDQNVPPPQMQMLQKQFGDWVLKKYGSTEKAFTAWNNLRLPQDNSEEGRLAFRPLYEIFTQRTPRDQDTVAFLLESQRGFYQDSVNFLRQLGFKGLITASNWTTANNDILGPLEKYSYTVGDFIDRHGYWGGFHQGEHSDWSIREGHIYSNRSALRFDPPEPGKPREFSHPVFDPKYNGLPSMISETTFTRPNRYRTEGPALYAAYGALQGSDSIVHFAMDGARWQVKPNFFMQPWTLMSPTMMGQFPATALIYRQGLIQEGELMADIQIPLADALALKGTTFAQQANLDQLRQADVPAASHDQANGIDPLIHLAGRTHIHVAEKVGTPSAKNLAPFINRHAKTVRSSTGELSLDYEKGILLLTGEKAQGIVGNLQASGITELPLAIIQSDLDLASILFVPLDGQPLQRSSQILLQVMTEEKATNFETEPAGEGKFRIKNIGVDPWLFRSPTGTIKLKRPDAAQLKVTPMDLNGYPTEGSMSATSFELQPDTAYYLITP
jgi:hypothetical protein